CAECASSEVGSVVDQIDLEDFAETAEWPDPGNCRDSFSTDWKRGRASGPDVPIVTRRSGRDTPDRGRRGHAMRWRLSGSWRGRWRRRAAPRPGVERLETRRLLTAAPTLTPGEVQQLLRRAAAASASDDAIIAVVDRMGDILGVRVEAGVSPAITGNTEKL